MNNKFDTGGPAFPHHVVCDKGWTETQILQGMTLRDYFAAKAMQAELQDGVHLDAMPTVAKRAYLMANAMLRARALES